MDFQTLGKLELSALLKEKGIKGYSKMNKTQMIEALKQTETKQDEVKVEVKPVELSNNSVSNEYSNLTTKQLRDVLKLRGCGGKLSDVNKTDLLKMVNNELQLPQRKINTQLNTWNLALCEFNKNRPQYITPKKGTEEYLAVLKIKEKLEEEEFKKKTSKI